MKENEDWDSIKNTIMDIKKKREETKRKRNYNIGEELSKMLSEELCKEIDRELLNRLTGLGFNLDL